MENIHKETQCTKGYGNWCCMKSKISLVHWNIQIIFNETITFLGILELLSPEEERLLAGFLN